MADLDTGSTGRPPSDAPEGAARDAIYEQPAVVGGPAISKTGEFGVEARSQTQMVVRRFIRHRAAMVSLVVREGQSFVPEPHTTIRHGDKLLVVTTSRTRARTEQRIRAISSQGRLAGWP